MEKENSSMLSRYMKARTIPNDAERQRALNQQRFPGRNYNPDSITKRPQNPEDYKNEATQTINPVTGRAYENLGKTGDDWEPQIRGEINNVIPENEVERIIYFKKYNDKIKEEKRNPSDLEFFNYQLALARKDVRDGKMCSLGYDSCVNSVNRVICALEEAGLPLTSINTASGLDDAIEGLELGKGRKYIKKYLEKIDLDLYKNISFLPIESIKEMRINSSLIEELKEKYPNRKPKLSREDKDKWLN